MIAGQPANLGRPVLHTQPVEAIRVLLIEDNPGYSEVIRIMLDKSPDIRCELSCVKRLSDGFNHLFDYGTDLILLDLKLPDSEGIETFNSVYAHAQNVPIIVLTVTDNNVLALEAVQKGAQDYLVKEQVDTKLLVHAIRYAVERKRMEKMLLMAAQEWRSTFDAISDSVCLIDPDRKIIRCNRAMTKFMQLSFADIIAQSCCELIHGNCDPIEECPFERMQKTHCTESIVMQRDDRWFNITVDPLLDEAGNLIGGVHILADITKAKEIEHMKSELISNVSHELRTPLSIIKDGIALISDGILGPLQSSQQEILFKVKNNIDRLARLINDLLDMSQIEAGRMALKKSFVNISDLIAEVCTAFLNSPKKKKIEFSTISRQHILPLYIDRDKICQVLTNLIDNSIKFTPEHGSIMIEITENENEVKISVGDTGIGISPDNIPTLFDRFSQFNRSYGPGERGTGLGLPLSKEIIEMHGGRIWAESELGKGSTLTFSLPRMSQDEIFRDYLTTGLREAAKKNCSLSLVVVRMKNIGKFAGGNVTETISDILQEIELLVVRTLSGKSDIVTRYRYNEAIVAILMTEKHDALFVKEMLGQAIENEIRAKKWSEDIGLFLDVVTYPDDALDEIELINKISQKF